ncbi:MAG: flagellar basal body P-ring protein FlgI [Planctomycetaceae bacterium]|jgi:flagellar basal body P-ring protein FlgI|nr:flagellar basal body P-ring protein FlgI [Phycisphaerales bacterium]MCE2652786.1 flagellar basal body P-ring protein FlgI [Planctomycetaceae bacterium]
MAICRSPISSPTRAVRVLSLALAGLALTLAPLAGCSNEKPPEARAVEPVVRDTPPALRGTIGAEARLLGTQPLLVSGYGLVVGLNGTGGGALPEAIASTMERELARGGIGRGGPLSEGPLAGRTPRQVLADPNVAVVIVEGVIASGMPRGTPFDVRVRPLPGSAVTSLEGGTLWTTELRMGPVTPFGSARTRKMAEARGPVFINPFADPAGAGLVAAGMPPAGQDTFRRDVGRVLGGGNVTDPSALEIVLDNPSHTRAGSIVAAINSRFPPGPGDDGPTARGRNATTVGLRIPRAFAQRPDDFIRLIEFGQIDLAFPEDYARRYAEELVKQPELAEELSWALRAIGRTAVPFVYPLYDSAEQPVRWAALRVGGFLGDARATPFLLDIADGTTGEPTALRTQAISLLGQMRADPIINNKLRTLASAGSLQIRIAAYEALLERADASITTVVVGDPRSPAGGFPVDLLPAGEPLIYMTQQGRPRLVIFGDDLRVSRPAIVSAWADRLMLASDSAGADTVRIRYTDYRTGAVVSGTVSEDIRSVIRFMAHTPSPSNPERGLSLTYSEIIGALYEMQRQNAIRGAFSTQTDRLAAQITAAEAAPPAEERPATEADRLAAQEREAAMKADGQAAAPATGPIDPRNPAASPAGTNPAAPGAQPGRRPLVRPLPQNPAPAGGSSGSGPTGD